LKRSLLENRRLAITLLVTAILPLAFSSVGIVVIHQNSWLFDLPGPKLFSIFTICSVILVGLALVPSTIVAILAGYFLGLYGLLSILISYPLAAILGLYIGRLIVRVVGIKQFSQMPDYADYVEGLARHELLFVINLRLSPALPFAMINVLLATLPITWFRYIAGSLIGMLPRTALFFVIGLNADQIWDVIKNPELEGAISLFPAALVVISLAGLAWILRSVIRDVVASRKEKKLVTGVLPQ